MRKLSIVLFATLIFSPILSLTSCANQAKHYIPTEDSTLKTLIEPFLSQFELIPEGEEDYWIRHENDASIFNLFRKSEATNTPQPIINLDFDNSASVNNFDINGNIFFKTFLATNINYIPLASKLYKYIELFPLIATTKDFTFTKGTVTMKEVGNDVTMYYLSLNLKSNVFWDYEINKTLNNYLINYQQTNPSFIFTQNSSEVTIIKEWLTAIYQDSKQKDPFFANIPNINNINDLYDYLISKISFKFTNLNTSIVGINSKYTLTVSDLNGDYEWNFIGDYVVN